MSEPEFINTEDAIARLGLNRLAFRKIVGLDPGGRFPWIKQWMRPNAALSTAREHWWATKDVEALARILDQWRGDPADVPDDEKEEKG